MLCGSRNSVIWLDCVNVSVNGCEVWLLWHYYDCRGYKEEELSTYMEGLHSYNEMKDIGQMLLGRLGKFCNERMLLNHAIYTA